MNEKKEGKACKFGGGEGCQKCGGKYQHTCSIAESRKRRASFVAHERDALPVYGEASR